jgi:hypothetical protein
VTELRYFDRQAIRSAPTSPVYRLLGARDLASIAVVDAVELMLQRTPRPRLTPSTCSLSLEAPRGAALIDLAELAWSDRPAECRPALPARRRHRGQPA